MMFLTTLLAGRGKLVLWSIGALILVGYISALNIRISSLKNDVQKATNKYDLLVNETAAAGLKQKAETLAIEQHQQKVTVDTALGFNDAFARQRKYYENKLNRNRVVSNRVLGQQPAEASISYGTVPESGTSASSPHEGAAHVAIDRPGEQAAEVTEEECAETTLQVLWLQDWARKQGLAPN
jgi:hypothetical protein